MEGKMPLAVVKHEPHEEETVQMSEIHESLTTSQSESLTESCDLNIPKATKKQCSTEKSLDAKRIKKEPQQAFGIKEGKGKKPQGAEMGACAEPPRAGVFPYRTKSDFCCTICNAHMNSIQMWENHIRGKRHLKNTKKGSATSFAASVPMPVKNEKIDDVEGLYYIDTQGAQSPPQSCAIYERPESPVEAKAMNVSSSPDQPLPQAAGSASVKGGPNLTNMTMTEKIDLIVKLSTSVMPNNESDFNEIKSILAALTQSIMQYEIRQLPFAAQQKLAKELSRGNRAVSR